VEVCEYWIWQSTLTGGFKKRKGSKAKVQLLAVTDVETFLLDLYGQNSRNNTNFQETKIHDGNLYCNSAGNSKLLKNCGS
jgi:hypothetical protein